MPSLTVQAAFIQLWAIDGAPWTCRPFQEMTGIKHGLFPEKDSDLPPNLSREDSIDIQSYWLAYLSKPENKRHHYSQHSNLPGRPKWYAYFATIWSKFQMHSLIVKCFRECGVHPISILSRNPSITDGWPKGEKYIPHTLEKIALELLGDDIYDSEGIMIKDELVPPLTAFAQRSWNVIRVKVRNDQRRVTTLSKNVEVAFEEVQNGNASRQKVAALIRSVAKWRDLSALYNSQANLDRADQLMADLDAVMEAIGSKCKAKKPPKAKPRIKATKDSLKIFATEDDLEELDRLYMDYFPMDFGDDDIIEELPKAIENLKFHDVVTGDLGVDIERVLSKEALERRLYFHKCGLPFAFNSCRHESGFTSWEHPELFLEPCDKCVHKHSLHWYQMVAVHAILRHVSTLEVNLRRCGVLLGDEVGLGKTTIAAAIVAFLSQTYWNQSDETPTSPPILRERPYIGKYSKIPQRPHLIVAPGTLLQQWIHELKTWFKPFSVDLLVYESGDESFWAEGGTYLSSKHEPQNRIILTTHSTLIREFRKYHRPTFDIGRPKSQIKPWEYPSLKPGCSARNTIFGQQFLTVVIDEAHKMKNNNATHWSALRIMEQGLIRLPMTATPLLTSPLDISAMGRLAGVHYFFTEEASEREKEDMAFIRQFSKKQNSEVSNDLQERRDEIIRNLQTQFADRIIRRMPSSKDFEGNTLLKLPQHKNIEVLLSLTEREQRILSKRLEAVKTDANAGNETGIVTRTFFLEYRTTVGMAKEDDDKPYPKFSTMEEWRQEMSTKMDAQAQIADYYLTHGYNALDVGCEDGHVVIPDVPKCDAAEVAGRRMVIYAEFSSMHSVLQNVLRLYGHESLSIDGKMSFKKRDSIVKQFLSKDSNARILILSGVGSAGLNLAAADIISFFDQPWSGQEEHQIEGRCIRQGQKRCVKVVHLLAIDSSDLHLHSIARGKKDMFEKFISKTEDLTDILTGKVTERGDEADSPAELSATATKQAAAPAPPALTVPITPSQPEAPPHPSLAVAPAQRMPVASASAHLQESITGNFVAAPSKSTPTLLLPQSNVNIAAAIPIETRGEDSAEFDYLFDESVSPPASDPRSSPKNNTNAGDTQMGETSPTQHTPQAFRRPVSSYDLPPSSPEALEDDTPCKLPQKRRTKHLDVGEQAPILLPNVDLQPFETPTHGPRSNSSEAKRRRISLSASRPFDRASKGSASAEFNPTQRASHQTPQTAISRAQSGLRHYPPSRSQGSTPASARSIDSGLASATPAYAALGDADDDFTPTKAGLNATRPLQKLPSSLKRTARK